MDMSRHPSAHGSQPTEAPASAGAQPTPNLPALITALPGDPGSGPGASHRAPQTGFDRTRQVLFLENLSVTGSVRSAASAAQTSHQSAYRARRACGAFRTAWDAALVVARAAAADTLAARAIDGVSEPVFYHGEEVGSRTRFSDRLLLAHLARLDRLVEDPRANAFAEDFDEALAGFGRGEAFVAPGVGDWASSVEVPASAGTHSCGRHRAPAQAGASIGDAPPAGFSSPGPCNTRSMSYTKRDEPEGRFDDDLAWEMAQERPLDAPSYDEFADPLDAEQCQREMFESGEEDWWRCGEAFMPYVRDGADGWMPDPEELAYRAAHPEEFGTGGGDDASAPDRAGSSGALE